MSTLTEIERAADALPHDQQERLFVWLTERLAKQPVKSMHSHSVLDIPPVSLGKIIHPLDGNDDLLGEMLEDRR